MDIERISHSPRTERQEVPKSFPIKEVAYDRYNEENGFASELQEDSIVHFTVRFSIENPHTSERFILLKKIGDLSYTFHLSEQFEDEKGIYLLFFKTKEYKYATTGLDPALQTELAATLKSFIESVEAATRVQEIVVDPADDSYSREDIESCIREILKSPSNTYTEEDLRKRIVGHEIFNEYRYLYRKDFKDTSKSKAAARSRYFKGLFSRVLPEWEIVPDSMNVSKFSLQPKQSHTSPETNSNASN